MSWDIYNEALSISTVITCFTCCFLSVYCQFHCHTSLYLLLSVSFTVLPHYTCCSLSLCTALPHYTCCSAPWISVSGTPAPLSSHSAQSPSSPPPAPDVCTSPVMTSACLSRFSFCLLFPLQWNAGTASP